MSDVVQEMTIRHDMLIDWLIANPERTQGDCAAAFNLTQAWLSTLLNSDMFKAKITERLAELGEGVREIIKLKMTHAADIAMDKTIEKLTEGASEDFLTQTRDTLLTRLGYGDKPMNGGNGHAPIELNIGISADLLNQARVKAKQINTLEVRAEASDG